MAVFPMYIELKDEICLVIGGGRVALRKALTLLALGAEVHVLSQTFVPEFEHYREERIECHPVGEGALAAAVWLEQNMKKEGIGHAAMLICATNQPEANHQLALWGKKNRIPVNSATSVEDCDFYFPAVVQRGRVVTGVSTGGGVPALSAYISKMIEETLPYWYDDLEETGRKAREILKSQVESGQMRKQLMQQILDEALAHQGILDETEMAKIIENHRECEQ